MIVAELSPKHIGRWVTVYAREGSVVTGVLRRISGEAELIETWNLMDSEATTEIGHVDVSVDVGDFTIDSAGYYNVELHDTRRDTGGSAR